MCVLGAGAAPNASVNSGSPLDLDTVHIWFVVPSAPGRPLLNLFVLISDVVICDNCPLVSLAVTFMSA